MSVNMAFNLRLMVNVVEKSVTRGKWLWKEDKRGRTGMAEGVVLLSEEQRSRTFSVVLVRRSAGNGVEGMGKLNVTISGSPM